MEADNVKTLSALCAREEWHKVKALADRLVAENAAPARFFQAIARFHLGEFLAAWFCAERALEELSDNAEVFDLCGRIASALGDADASEILHARAIQRANEEMRAPLAYNFVGSMMRLGEWSKVSSLVAEYGSLWDQQTRKSLLLSMKLVGPEKIELDGLQEMAEEVGLRPPFAASIASAMHQSGAWQEADQLLARTQLIRNDPLIAANRILLLLDADQASHAYDLWRREREFLRQEGAIANALQGALLVKLGSVDAGLRLLAAHRPHLRLDRRMTEVRDGLAILHANVLHELGRRAEGRRVLIQELQSSVASMPRAIKAVRELVDDYPSGMASRLEVWEVAYQRDGDHWVRVIVNAMTGESARMLAIETLPEGLQALPYSLCRLVDEPSLGGLGVVERWIGYRVSRDLLA